MQNSLPNWLRWVALLPVAMAGGWVVGYGIYLLNASYAERPDAPIVYIADFAGSVASTLVALSLAFAIAPTAKAKVVAILVVTTALSSFGVAYLLIQRDAMMELIGVAGDLVGCLLGWRKFVRRPDDSVGSL